MSDEESFVILGTSPTSSLDTINSLPPAETTTTETGSQKLVADGVEVQSHLMLASTSSSNSSQFTAIDRNSIPSGMGQKDETVLDYTTPSPKPSLNRSTSSAAEPLATSFLLGHVGQSVLVSSVESQFPSLTASGNSRPDMDRENLVAEMMELKKCVVKSNATLRKVIEQQSQANCNVSEIKAQHIEEMAKMRNQKMELQRDLEAQIDQIKQNEEVLKRENEEFIRDLSAKTALINNMKVQIEKLEQQQHASFEFVPKGTTDTAMQSLPEYVPISQYQHKVKQLEDQLSQLLAENLEIKDMQKNYIDEITCLKVNLESSNELLRKAQADINLLQSGDLERNSALIRIKKEYMDLKVHCDVLQQQVDIYMRDFKMEQDMRENLSNEKEMLLNDLRELQKKNQQLIQEAKRTYEEHTRQTMATQGAFPKSRAPVSTSSPSSSSPKASNPIYKPTTYFCPLCGAVYKTLSVLQNHLEQCLND